MESNSAKQGKTIEAKIAAKRMQIENLTPEERMMLPLYLHYREKELTGAMRPNHERKENTENP